MPNLPYKFVVTPLPLDKYEAILAALKEHQGATVTPFGLDFGEAHTQDVDFSYEYDGNSRLTITVTAANTFLARHVSDETIESHVRSLIQKAS